MMMAAVVHPEVIHNLCSLRVCWQPPLFVACTMAAFIVHTVVVYTAVIKQLVNYNYCYSVRMKKKL